VSYQFPLFQAAIEGISVHNVFEGRNSSVGERSMLGVVQQVAKDIGNVEVGTLATFDHMFAGIRLPEVGAQRFDRRRRTQPRQQLAIRLLKALFLVKYVESFRPAQPHRARLRPLRPRPARAVGARQGSADCC
jgi:hypothetical protein